ncbi:hypothetical protein Btru_053162 [Bulinus truncatus]|nr:hypothetical protein Btru_053162 [Bulinus truncatus]
MPLASPAVAIVTSSASVMDGGAQPPRTQRRLSTRMSLGVPLTGTSKLNIVKNDLDLSMNVLSSTRKTSDESTRSSVLPRLSIVSESHLVVGKRVAFKLDELPETSTKKDKQVKIAPDKFPSQSKLISKEAVKYDLEHKGMDNVSVYDFFRSRFSDGGEAENGLASPELSATESELKVTEDIGVSFVGGLRRVGLPVFGRLEMPSDLKIRNHESKRASVCTLSTTSSYFMDNLWPWPWLDFRMRAADLYKGSEGPGVTFSRQKDLPDLPVPILGRSLLRFLQSMRTCVNEKSLKHVQKLAEEFALGDGPTCQNLLNDAATIDRNWIRRVLPNYSRLYSRLSAPILNRGIVCPYMYDLWPENADTQIERAAILIDSAVEFWMILRKEALGTITDDKGHPICMHEFRRLFSSVRIPGQPADAIFTFFHSLAESDDTSKHIIVIYRGHIFTMGVMDTNYVAVSRKSIRLFLKEIVQSVEDSPDDSNEGQGVGILTSLGRDVWSEVRQELMKMNEANAVSLKEIETAMFVLSMDKLKINDPDRLPHEAIFGDGYNRWYDKNLNFYVYANGLVTVNVNSALLEGNIAAILLHYIHLKILESVEKWDEGVVCAVSKTTLVSSRSRGSSIFNDLLAQIKSKMSDLSSASQSAESMVGSANFFPDIGGPANAPRKLVFALDEQLEEYIGIAESQFSNLAASISTSVCVFDEYERNLFKDKGVNTDAFAHMVIHYTFYTMYGRPPSVGAAVSLKRFYHGRFELMRSTTEEIIAWCRAMSAPGSTNALKQATFWKAVKKHRRMLRESSSGQGFENHLAALKVVAEDMLMKTPTFFRDDVVKSRESFEIFTECLGVGCTSCAAVLPTSPEGYGVGYFVANTKIVFNVSAWQDVATTSAELYAQSLRNTMLLLYRLLHSLSGTRFCALYHACSCLLMCVHINGVTSVSDTYSENAAPITVPKSTKLKPFWTVEKVGVDRSGRIIASDHPVTPLVHIHFVVLHNKINQQKHRIAQLAVRYKELTAKRNDRFKRAYTINRHNKV